MQKITGLCVRAGRDGRPNRGTCGDSMANSKNLSIIAGMKQNINQTENAKQEHTCNSEGTKRQRAKENTGLYTQSNNQGMGNRRETQLREIRAEKGGSKTESTDIGLRPSK